MNELVSNRLAIKISELLISARSKVLHTVNHTMVLTYYEIGRMIIEEEQKGKQRADYGKQIIKTLSERLSKEFGKGFSQRNLEQIRQFYSVYSKTQTLSAEFNLSWSHYMKLMRIDDDVERKFYEIEAYKNNWSLRELNRQYDTALFTRLTLSKDENEILQLSVKGQIIEKPQDAIKDPYILEFIGLPENNKYSESELKLIFTADFQDDIKIKMVQESKSIETTEIK